VGPYSELGNKVFAVTGGSVQVYAMPGGGGTPAWFRLARTAPVGANTLYVDTDPSSWPIGAQVRFKSGQIITKPMLV
jgi:tripartite-type tricarboxylate transporter receptor subunit TctC